MDQQQETTNNEMQRSNTPYSKSLIGIVIALVILAFAAGAGFMTYYNSINKPQVKIENPTTNKPDTQTEDTADSKIAKEIKNCLLLTSHRHLIYKAEFFLARMGTASKLLVLLQLLLILILCALVADPLIVLLMKL